MGEVDGAELVVDAARPTARSVVADGLTVVEAELGHLGQGELPLELQPRLLRVLETGEVRQVGSDETKRVDVRIIAATNRDLGAEARRGAFREDLLYRLDVVRVRMPALRHRPDDLPTLLAALLGDTLDPADPVRGPNLERLMAYAWLGNAPELRNVLRRAVTMWPGARDRRIGFSELVFNLGPSASPATFGIHYPGVESPMDFMTKDGLVTCGPATPADVAARLTLAHNLGCSW